MPTSGDESQPNVLTSATGAIVPECSVRKNGKTVPEADKGGTRCS